MNDWPTRIAPDHTAARRARARRDPSLAAEAVRLADLSPGGSFDLPIEATSASEIEIRATSAPCPICWGEQRWIDHVVEWRAHVPRRVVSTKCWHCGLERNTYFAIRSTRVA